MVDFNGNHNRVLQKEFFTLISLKKRKRIIFEKHKVFSSFKASC